MQISKTVNQFLSCLLCFEDLCSTSWILTSELMLGLFHEALCIASYTVCSISDLWNLESICVSSFCGRNQRCLFLFLLEFTKQAQQASFGWPYSQHWTEQQLNSRKSLYSGYSLTCCPINDVICDSDPHSYSLRSFFLKK